MYAFCGGIKKNSGGTWSSTGTVTDHTRAAMAYTNSYSVIKAKPLGKTKCKSYVANHKSWATQHTAICA